LQRMRAGYAYVSTWWRPWAWQYEFFAAVAIAGLGRVRAAREHWIWLGGLVVAGILSTPLSWLLLEQMHLAVVPQVQPARALLFVTGIAALMAAIAGAKSLERRSLVEAALWFLFCFLVPLHAAFFQWPGARVILVSALLSMGCAAAFAFLAPRWRVAAALLIAPLTAYGANVVLYGNTATADLRNLAGWAAVKAHGVYFFPEAGRDHAPGWFRANALQPVYVDWKGGGQVNYIVGFAREWSVRWNQVAARGPRPESYADLPVDYLAYAHPCKTSLPLAFHNNSWWVYHLNAHGSIR